MAPNDRHDDTQRPAYAQGAQDTLPAELRPVHELVRELGAAWQRQLPSADTLNARLPLLLQDAPDASAAADAGRTRPPLRQYHREYHLDRARTGDLPGGIVGRGSTSRPRPPHHLFAVVAALLLIALGGSVFAVFAAQRPGPGTTLTRPTTPAGTPTPTAPAITRVLAPQPQNPRLPVLTNAYVQSISLSSASDGWAGGGVRIPDVGGADWSQAQTYLAHYHNGAWTRSAETYRGAAITAVSMVSADEGWAIGATNWDQATNTNGHDVLLHYTGGHWHNLGTFVPQGVFLTDMHMNAAGWGYATGSATASLPGQLYTQQNVLVIAVSQGGSWHVIQTTFEAYASFAVMVSPDEGWVVGTDLERNGATGFFHYTHGSWNQVSLISFDAYSKVAMSSLTMASPQDMWASGTACTPMGVPLDCHLLTYHFDGTSWQAVAPPDTSSVDWSQTPELIQIFSDETGAAWLSFSEENTAVPPAQRQYDLVLYHYARGEWVPETLPVAHLTLVSFASDQNGGTWAVGATQNPYASYVFYTQGDGAWRVYGHT